MPVPVPQAIDIHRESNAAIETAVLISSRSIFFFSSRRRHTRYWRDWSSDVCSSDLIARGEKVLACAPSNLAVDNLLERLVHAREKAIRLGHPARVLPELQEHTLDLLVDVHPDVAVARRLIREANQLRDKAARFTRAKPLPGARQQMRAEARELIADARRIETQVAEHLLDSASVLCHKL